MDVVHGTPQVNQLKYAKESILKKKANRKAKTAKVAMAYETWDDDDDITRDDLRRARTEDDSYMTVLDKYQIPCDAYKIIVERFDAMYDSLMDDVEYRPAELVGGNPVHDKFLGLDGHIETVLSLKHMATLPDARLIEVQWGTFMLAP